MASSKISNVERLPFAPCSRQTSGRINQRLELDCGSRSTMRTFLSCSFAMVAAILTGQAVLPTGPFTFRLVCFLPLRTFEITNRRANGRDELPLIRIYPPFDLVDFPDAQELVPNTMDGPYTRLTEADYDSKLREMGNYLWELEQELLTCDTREAGMTAHAH